MSTITVRRPPAAQPSLLLMLSVMVLAILLTSCFGSQPPRRVTLLVVGDSVAAQSAEALIHLAPPGTSVAVDAVAPGTAPCDWDRGFTDPTDGEAEGFTRALRTVRPSVLVFVFTGNPGLSGPTAGCVDAESPYDLPQLLASYRSPLVDMANKAVRQGATVYFEAPPPRNPAVTTGYDPLVHVNRGFQGSPGVASFYERLAATSASHRWKYDDKAAVAVSTSGLSWRLTLPCEAWDAASCTNGQVQVRVGGEDAVHLDERGCGAVRFALGLEERSLGTTARPIDATSVAQAVAHYGGCQ